MISRSILVIEDDALARLNLEDALAGHKVDFAVNKEDARKKLESGKPDVCFIDLSLGDDDDCSGLELIPLAKVRGAYAVVMSGYEEEAYVEKATELGCDLFFSKADIKEGVNETLARFERSRRRADPWLLLAERYVTVDPATKKNIGDALKFAASDLPILVLGPTGSGKTRLARMIHDQSGRAGQFVALNCSSYTDELLEVELFGAKKGAYTDAKETRKGKLLLADRGTLFLDEIGDMSATMQTKLLKAIEEQEFYPLGSDQPQVSRFRIISATWREPAQLLPAGKLRHDFYERIHGVTVRLPALAQRRCDVLPLVEHFNRKGRKLVFSAQAKDRLLRHSWPGNVRELQKLVELLKADEHARVTPERVEELLNGLPMLAAQEGAQALTEEQFRYAHAHGLNALVDRLIEAAIRRSLAENGGNKRRVKADLKIANRVLYKSLRGTAPREAGEALEKQKALEGAPDLQAVP